MDERHLGVFRNGGRQSRRHHRLPLRPARGRLGDDAFTRATTVVEELRGAADEDAGAQRRGHMFPDAKTRIVGLAERLRGKKWVPLRNSRAWLRDAARTSPTCGATSAPTSAAHSHSPCACAKTSWPAISPSGPGWSGSLPRKAQPFEFRLGGQQRRPTAGAEEGEEGQRPEPARRRTSRSRSRRSKSRRGNDLPQGGRLGPGINSKRTARVRPGGFTVASKNLRLAVGVPLAVVVSLGVVAPDRPKTPNPWRTCLRLHRGSGPGREPRWHLHTHSAHAGTTGEARGEADSRLVRQLGLPGEAAEVHTGRRVRSTHRRTWSRFARAARRRPIRPGPWSSSAHTTTPASRVGRRRQRLRGRGDAGSRPSDAQREDCLRPEVRRVRRRGDAGR